LPGSRVWEGEEFKLFDNLCENYVTIERKKSDLNCVATRKFLVFIGNCGRIINQLAATSYFIPDVSFQILLWFHFVYIVEYTQWANELEELVEHKVEGPKHVEQLQYEQYPI